MACAAATIAGCTAILGIDKDYGDLPGGAGGGAATANGGSVPGSGAPATATWPMYSGTTIVLGAMTTGAVSATSATLTGLVAQDVANGAARFDVPTDIWNAETGRNADRYVQFTVPVTSGTFALDTISVRAGSGGGSYMLWDIVYSLSPDLSSPTALGTALSGVKDTLVTNSYSRLGVNISAGQTLYLRVYPYDSTTTLGKSLMLANVVVSGVTH